MNFGLCHSCGSGDNVIFCDGHCSRAFCEVCINNTFGSQLSPLFADPDQEFECLSCMRGDSNCWICGMHTTQRGGFQILTCASCQIKSEVCTVCSQRQNVSTCYYCLKSFHPECCGGEQIDVPGDITAGLCSACITAHPLPFKGTGTNMADVHPFQGLISRQGNFGQFCTEFWPEIQLEPSNPEKQHQLGELISCEMDPDVLDSVPDILNVLPLKIYNIDVIQWIMEGVQGVIDGLNNKKSFYRAVQERLAPYEKKDLPGAIRLKQKVSIYDQPNTPQM